MLTGVLWNANIVEKLRKIRSEWKRLRKAQRDGSGV